MHYYFFFVQLVVQEVTSIKDSYKKKAKMTRKVFNSMENVKCNEVAGRCNVCVSEDNNSKVKAFEAAKVSCPVSGPDLYCHTAEYCQ